MRPDPAPTPLAAPPTGWDMVIDPAAQPVGAQDLDAAVAALLLARRERDAARPAAETGVAK
jgi:hypothetical protein